MALALLTASPDVLLRRLSWTFRPFRPSSFPNRVQTRFASLSSKSRADVEIASFSPFSVKMHDEVGAAPSYLIRELVPSAAWYILCAVADIDALEAGSCSS